MVHVQFGLGQSGYEGVQVACLTGGVCGGTVGQGSSPGTASPAAVRRDADDRLIGDSGIIVGRAGGGRGRAVA
ncbi:hypothetical protein GCM10027072_67290 [Streptomyces bullii]